MVVSPTHANENVNSPTRELAHSDDRLKTLVGFYIVCVNTVGIRSQAVVSRSDSDKCVTRLVGQMTSLSLGQLTIPRVDPLKLLTVG